MHFRRTHFSLADLGENMKTAHLDPRVPLCYFGIDHTFGVCRASREKEHVESSGYMFYQAMGNAEVTKHDKNILVKVRK